MLFYKRVSSLVVAFAAASSVVANPIPVAARVASSVTDGQRTPIHHHEGRIAA